MKPDLTKNINKKSFFCLHFLSVFQIFFESSLSVFRLKINQRDFLDRKKRRRVVALPPTINENIFFGL